MFTTFLKKMMAAIKLKKLKKEGTRIGKGTLVFTTRRSFGSEPYLIHIGENCVIANGVKFITHDGAIRVFNKQEEYKQIDNKYGRIDIKDNVYIGENSIIMPNVSIGPNACILPGSVVFKDIPPNSVSAGNPASVKNSMDNFVEYYNSAIYPDYKKMYTRLLNCQMVQMLVDEMLII